MLFGKKEDLLRVSMLGGAWCWLALTSWNRGHGSDQKIGLTTVDPP